MQPQNDREAKRWLDEAAADLDTAKYLRKGKRFNTACFIAQQAAEKAVKAFLFAQDVESPWGHSVATLVEAAITFDGTLELLRDPGPVLDKYYIPTRYPNGLPGGIPSKAYTVEDATQAIDAAANVLAEIGARIR
jgi:HEPN domain-containing protein